MKGKSSWLSKSVSDRLKLVVVVGKLKIAFVGNKLFDWATKNA